MGGTQKTAPKGASGGHNGGAPLTFRSCSLQMILWDWDLKHWYKPQYQVSTALTSACTCMCTPPLGDPHSSSEAPPPFLLSSFFFHPSQDLLWFTGQEA